MLTTSHTSKVFVCQKPVDFRYGFDRLAHLCKSKAGESPYDGSLFVFFNRAFNRAKIIFYDGSGCVMLWKRLEKGRFKIPKLNSSGDFSSIKGTDLLLILEGVDIKKLKRPEGWKPGKLELVKSK